MQEACPSAFNTSPSPDQLRLPAPPPRLSRARSSAATAAHSAKTEKDRLNRHQLLLLLLHAGRRPIRPRPASFVGKKGRIFGTLPFPSSSPRASILIHILEVVDWCLVRAEQATANVWCSSPHDPQLRKVHQSSLLPDRSITHTNIWRRP